MHTEHGISREDPWHWLRNRDDPRVLDHLKAENAYTEAVMADAGDLPKRLYRELIGRIEETSVSAPWPDGRWVYRSRIEKGEDYALYERRPRAGGDWTCYFNGPAEAAGTDYFEIGCLDVSPDGTRLAYAIDTSGDESYTLRFRDLVTGKDLPGQFEETAGEGEWDASGTRYYFVREDETRRPDRIFRHTIGANPDAARLVYTESDPRFHAGIEKSQDGRYLFTVSESKETREVGFLDAGAAGTAFTPILPRRDGIRYGVEHHSAHWLIHSNEDAPDYKLLRVPVCDPRPEQGELIWAPRPGVRLEEILPLENWLIFVERERGLERIRVRSLVDGTEHLIPMEDPVHDLQLGPNAEFATNVLDFNYSSPIRPRETVRYDLRTRTRTLLRRVKVPSGHDPDAYTVYRIEAEGADGTRIPMTVLHRGDLPLNGTNPAYLYGYGAYGSTVETGFRTSWLTWLQRGFVVAIAHVRGGGLLGEDWYQSGKLGNKENTFSDFIACAEALVKGDYTRPERLLIEGGSAGGLLVGAVLNLRPDLFRAAVAGVPFVDVLNTMSDPSLPLTTSEYEEWGNPKDPGAFNWIRAYAPFENIRDAAYPAVLATGGLNDPRVPYWEAAKWVARLRKHQQSDAPVLLKIHLDSGHMGASGRYAHWREIAFEQAFLLHQLGYA